MPDESQTFRRPSILFRPRLARGRGRETGKLVEAPGTAPGSERLLRKTFIVIVGQARRIEYRDFGRISQPGAGYPRWNRLFTAIALNSNRDPD